MMGEQLDYLLNIVKNDKKFLETLKNMKIDVDSDEELSKIFL